MDKQTQTLVTDNLKLVHKMAHKYVNRVSDNALDYDDLYGEGCVGLIEAAIRFEPEKGYRFSTYACRYISGFILRHIRRKGFVSVPHHIVDVASVILKGSLQDLKVEEIAAQTGYKELWVNWALQYLELRSVSIGNGYSSDAEDVDFNNYVPYYEDYSTPYVEDFIRSLKPHHKEVLLMVMKGMDFRQIGSRIGITYQGVGNRMVKVRKYMTKYQAAAYGEA